MKRVFRNLSKGKLIIGVIVLCLMVVGGYFGYHRLVVHAGKIPTKQVVNTLAQYKAMCEKGDVDPTEEAGDKNNPFLILEIVPYYGQAEMGYLISGCEPIDFSKVNPSKYGAASDGTRSVSVHIFADEYMRDADNNGEPDEEWSDDWKQNTDGTKKTVHGFYEKVADNKPADFVIDHYEEDTSGMFYYKDADGNEHPSLRPVFRKAEQGEKAEFIWVSVYSNSASPYTITESSFNRYARKENKVIEPDAVGSTTPKGTVTYTPGEREYTIRTDSNYYCINEGGWINVNGESVFAGHAINMDDFIRTSLNLEDKSVAAINDLRLAIKTIEPKELQNHPEWIDYADLIYIHQGYSVGAYGDFWHDTKYDKYHRVKDELGESFYKNEDDSTREARQKLTSAKFTSDNDWGWKVAKQMFFKINQLGEYDGTGTYGFAPLLFSVTALDNLNGISDSVFTGDSNKTVVHNHLDYTTMEAGGVDYTTRATNCGLYKFMMMNFLMDQENFYRYFFETNRKSTGDKVITENASTNVSYNSPQSDAIAQEYWSVDAFLPITEKINDTNISDEQIERYDISHFGNAYLNYPRPSLHGATFIYNSDTLLSQGFNNASIQRNDQTEEAFKWFEEEYGISYDSITPAQMVHYLLQYKKHGYDDDDIGTPDKEPMKVLEIEPCADFFITEEYLVGKYLPPARFEGSIEVDHMTTAEFNGLKKDIIGEYDLIYIGVNIGKFNVNANKKTRYNDSDLDQFIYLHVGDRAGSVRSSGDDISKLKVTELKEYAQGGNALVLADDLSSFPVDEDGEDVTSGPYVNTYQKIVDSTSNMHTLLNALKSKNSNKFKRNNVCSLSKLSIKFLSKYCLGYMNEGFSLPSQYISGLNSSQYKTLLERYGSYEGLLYKITSTPKTYISDDGMSDDSVAGGSGVKQKLDGSTLDFSFLIGDQDTSSKYAVRLFIDLDGNGVITSDELVKDTYANNSGSTYSFSGVAATDANGNAFVDRKGNEILVPREQSFSYDFGSNTLLNLIKNRRSGALTWKFVLYNTSTPQNYISATGTSWYQNPNATPKKAQLNALQIISDSAKGSAVDLQSQLQNSGSLFATYATNLDDYEISIDTITLSEFLTQYGSSENGTGAGTAAGTAEEDYNGYIVSCGSELFAAQDNQAAVGYLTAKAQQGVGIVFTGEAVSKKAAVSAAKDMLNMSRFTDSLSLYGDYNDSATKPSGGKYSDTDKLEYSYATVMEKGTGYYKVYSNDLWGNSVKYGNKASKADAVSRNNRGSITTYPYTIDASVSISGDAAQDYQLNVDNPNLVVWYSLDGEEDSLYGISPRDAANNYYLYSVSNVTYDLINLETVSDPMEMKLFINALVGSIKTMSPQVIVDSGKAVDSNYKDFKIQEASEDYFGDSIDSQAGSKQSDNDEEMTVFKGVIQPNGASYQDYETGAKKVTGGSSSSGTKSDGDDDDPTPAPATPTPVPKKDPVILYSSSNAVGDNNGNWSTSDTSAFNEWGDSAILVIEYNTDNGWSGESYGIARFKNESDQVVGTLPNKAQAYSIKLGALKEMYGQSEGLSYFKLEGDWQFKLITIGIFEDMDQFTQYKNGGSGSEEEGGTGEDISDESDTEAMGDHVEIADKSGYVPDTATHRINFTPYTNLTGVSNVNSFKISLISASKDKLGTSDEKVLGYVDEIYQKYTDAAGKHIFKYTATELAHTFTLAKNNFLKDKTQYYFFSDESYINNTTAYDNENTRWVRFDISNKRKAAITYLHLYYEGDVDTTYVFPLD